MSARCKHICMAEFNLHKLLINLQMTSFKFISIVLFKLVIITLLSACTKFDIRYNGKYIHKFNGGNNQRLTFINDTLLSFENNVSMMYFNDTLKFIKQNDSIYLFQIAKDTLFNMKKSFFDSNKFFIENSKVMGTSKNLKF